MPSPCAARLPGRDRPALAQHLDATLARKTEGSLAHGMHQQAPARLVRARERARHVRRADRPARPALGAEADDGRGDDGGIVHRSDVGMARVTCDARHRVS
jgi:hypothetical protein